MPRKKKIDIDIEDSLAILEDPEEVKEFIEEYTTSSIFSSYPHSEYEYDMDNYGYDEGYDRY